MGKEKLPGMERETDEESDCGIQLIPCAVSKPKARIVSQELRKEVDFLRNLRKEYEVNMLEVKKENLDLKIARKAIEDHRKDFLEAVTRGRLQWKNEKEYLEKQLVEAKETIADLKGKLRLKENILEKVSSRARSPSVMPKEEREAMVDKVMEDVTMRNEIRATALMMKRLKDQNEELGQKNLKLAEENNMMKLKFGELQACATFDMETRLKTLQEARQKIEQATNQAGISKAIKEDVVAAFRLPSFKWQEEEPRKNSMSSIKENQVNVVRVENVRRQSEIGMRKIAVAEDDQGARPSKKGDHTKKSRTKNEDVLGTFKILITTKQADGAAESSEEEKRLRSEVVTIGNVRSQTNIKRKMIVVEERSGRRRAFMR